MQRHKIKKLKLVGTFVFSFLALINIQAQEQTQSLTLEQALEIAKKSNWDIRKNEAETQIARASFKETNALFLPKITTLFSFSYHELFKLISLSSVFIREPNFGDSLNSLSLEL